MTVVQSGPDLGQLALQDRRVARDLAAAERERLLAEQRIARDDAEAERRLRMQDGKLQLEAQRDRVKADRAERRRTELEAAREAKRARKQVRRAELGAWVQRRVEYVRDNAAAVYCGLVYGLAVSGAVYGQVDAARSHGLPTPVGVIAAVAIEGTGLAMALTAQQQRLRGERATVARSLIWICTAAAVAINAIGHGSEPVKAVGLSVLSALGIIVYEVRSGAKHRAALRDLGMIPEPPERFGWRRWVTYPWETFAAWRVDVRDRLSPGAKALISQADERRAAKQTRIEQRRAANRAQLEARRGERRQVADAERERRRQQKMTSEVAGRARKAAQAATKKGEAGAALDALVQLAHTGTPAALTEAEARTTAAEARAEAETAVRAKAEAEAVTATRRAEAEATRRAEAEAEAVTATRRAEAEATRRAEAEAEAAIATRRAEAEATRRVEAEAEAATALERVRAEAEAARSELRSVTAQSSRTQGQLDAELAEARRQAQHADAAERELLVARQAQSRAEALAEAARQEAADLRTALTQAAAESGRRPRRTTASSKPAAEPVLFDGQPVPHVERVSPETVRAVLQARKDHPDATQRELAEQVSTSERTVRTVLTAVAAKDGRAS